MKTQSSSNVDQEQPATLSLLDQIVERQADVASRYMPVMSVEQAVQRGKEIEALKQLVLREGEDYGIIPGTDKPTLLKPGAEKICAHFGYVPEYEIMPGSIEDWAGVKFGEPLFYFHVRCTLRKDGDAVGQGTGSCNSWEKKYRYRNAARACTACGKQTLIKGKTEWERDPAYQKRGSWVCYEKKGGCGAKYFGDDPVIMGQQVGQIANPDFADIINTIQKMADKRAYVASALSATGASQYFTQDVEDAPPPDPTVQEIRREAAAVDTGGAPVGTKQAAQNVAERKIAEGRATAVTPSPIADGVIAKFASKNFKGWMDSLGEMKSVVGEDAYYAALAPFFPDVVARTNMHANQLQTKERFLAFYSALVAIAKQGVPA